MARHGGGGSVECCPVGVSTTIGWVLSGPVKNLPKERLSSILFLQTHVLRVDSRSNYTLYEDFDKLWDLDCIGIREKDTVLEAFEKNVSFQGGRYSVYLPCLAPQVAARQLREKCSEIELTSEAIKKRPRGPKRI